MVVRSFRYPRKSAERGPGKRDVRAGERVDTVGGQEGGESE